jgi:hypothetical protein
VDEKALWWSQLSRRVAAGHRAEPGRRNRIDEGRQKLANRSVSAQELKAQLTQEFFNGVINNLRTQAQNNRALA